MEVHLADPGEREAGNYRNGTSPKTVDTGSERIVLDIPRDRQGRFDPVLIGKYQRRFPGFDEKIIAMCTWVECAPKSGQSQTAILTCPRRSPHAGVQS